MYSGELTETVGQGTKRATDERNRGKVRQRSHEVPLGEQSRAFSEKRAFHLCWLLETSVLKSMILLLVYSFF